ncbi:MAG: DNA cytosine methyltransferase [Waterburya sp.]
MIAKPTVIDLFCGCGGLSYGFMEAGYELILGIDIWQDAINTFKYNHDCKITLVSDLSLEKPNKISSKTSINFVDVIIGGPPCQGFSIAGKRIINDERNQLYKSFISFVKFYQPKAFLMENVPNIMSMGSGLIKKTIVNDFEEIGYTVVSKILIASDYGVPQNRKRAFFVGLKNGKKFDFPDPLQINPVTSEEAISDLSESTIVNGSFYPKAPLSKYQEYIRKGSKTIFNHEITNHKQQTIQIISMVPDGGNYKDLPEEFQDTRKVNIAWTRLNSTKPSFTIDTGHRHHFHYKYNRIPTVRESARLQSFPDSFVFLGSKTSQYKQVGNAVPPILAKELAKSLIQYL